MIDTTGRRLRRLGNHPDDPPEIPPTDEQRAAQDAQRRAERREARRQQVRDYVDAEQAKAARIREQWEHDRLWPIDK